MDGFSYYNIFDTKGIEYLVIIAFLLLLIPFWLVLNKQVKVKEQVSKSLGVLKAAILNIPQGIFYSRNHTWAYLGKSGTAKVGLDDLLLHITGEVKIQQLKNPGDNVNKGDLLAVLVQDSKSLNVFSPISGTIFNTNQVLNLKSNLLIDDPYGKGWIYEIKPSKWVSEIASYYLADDATAWFKKELERYKDFLSINMQKLSPATSMVVLQDGGELLENSLSDLPDEIWLDFQKQFLNQV